MSEIKVDALSTVSGSGNLTVDTDTLVVDTTNNNVFVKKTSAAYQTVGHELKSDGRAFHTSNGGKALSLVRNTSNGAILDFYNSGGTEVGSIETSASGIGIRLGGTASANLLDDYEEGDFTPTLTPGGGSYNGLTLTGKYTKIGRLVSVQMTLVITASGNASGSATVGNLPFTSITWNRMPNKWRENQATGACGQFVMNQNSTSGFMQNDDGTNIAHTTGRTYLINAVYYSV